MTEGTKHIVQITTGDANGDPRLLMGQLEDGGGFGEGGGGSAASRHHGGVVEHRQSYRLSGLPDEVNYEVINHKESLTNWLHN